MRGHSAPVRAPRIASLALTSVIACLCFTPGQAMAQDDAAASSPEAESGVEPETASQSESAAEAETRNASEITRAQPTQTFVGGPSHERRRELYEEAKLDHQKALLYSAALPGLGNFYADRIFRGATWMGIFGMSIFCGLAGWRTSDNRLVILGISGGVVSYAGGFLTSYRDVTTYNETLRRRYKVHETEQSTRAPVGFGYTWRF